MAAPLTLKDRVIGMVTFTAREPRYFTPRHATLALAIANQAAIAIENARLYEQAQQLAALEERQRLARELHDSVSQALYGIALGAHTARTLLDRDRKSTRLNSSHVRISYAVFCLKKKKHHIKRHSQRKFLLHSEIQWIIPRQI